MTSTTSGRSSLPPPAEAVAAAAVIAAERMLLDPTVRGRSAAVEALLDPAFREIGASGRLWTRAEMVTALGEPDMSAALDGVSMTDIEVERLGSDLFLLTYLVEVDGVSSRRSSIWRYARGAARIVFHQGSQVAITK